MQYISRNGRRVDEELARIVPELWDVPGQLRESMTYSLLAGGKRLRPILLLAAVRSDGRIRGGGAACRLRC